MQPSVLFSCPTSLAPHRGHRVKVGDGNEELTGGDEEYLHESHGAEVGPLVQGRGGGDDVEKVSARENEGAAEDQVKSSTNTPVMQGAKQMHIERRCDVRL